MTIWAYIAGFLSFCYIIWNVFFIRIIIIFFIIATIKYNNRSQTQIKFQIFFINEIFFLLQWQIQMEKSQQSLIRLLD